MTAELMPPGQLADGGMSGVDKRGTPLHSVSGRAGLTAAAAAAAVLAAAGCSSSSSSSSSALVAAPASASGSSRAPTSAPTVTPSLSVGDLNRSFSAMARLKPLAAEGKGGITVLLPDTTSARYADFDKPYLDQAFADADLSSTDYTVENALGSEAKQLSMAESAVNAGASVLVLDPVDSAVGARIESYAKQKGVAVVDYDQLTPGGSASYYVGFNDVKAGTLLGQGLVSCVSAWGVKDPDVLVMNGAPAGEDATLFAQGYNAVLGPYFSSGKWTEVSTPAGTPTASGTLSEFEQQYSAHKDINAALVPDDDSDAQVIQYLRSQGVKPKTFPTTGQGATLAGLQNILAGYQCGTVYKPVYLEAQAAAALALYLRADKNPPSSLVNGQTEDTATKAEVPSVLLTPQWVTAATMNATVIADKFVTASQLCAGSYASDCAAAGISG